MILPTIFRQEAMIEIALNGSFDELVALVSTDPLCSRLPIGRCREMVKKMLIATQQWIRNPRLLAF